MVTLLQASTELMLVRRRQQAASVVHASESLSLPICSPFRRTGAIVDTRGFGGRISLSERLTCHFRVNPRRVQGLFTYQREINALTAANEESAVLLRVGQFRGSRVRAVDASLGRVRDVYFDDGAWTARYLAVDTGRWRPGGPVLVALHSVEIIDPVLRAVMLSLTRASIRSGPAVDTDKPMSGDVHLPSAKEVSGYSVAAIDGNAGRVRDFLFDDETWAVRFLMVKVGTWPFAQQVLLSPERITQVDRAGRCVRVDLSRREVKGATGFEPGVLPPGDMVTASSEVSTFRTQRGAENRRAS